jgi:hypothetical protein
MSLPFKTIYAPDPAQTERWLTTLEELGVENVRIRLAQSGGDSAGVLYGIKSETSVTRGFVEDWLQHKQKEIDCRASQIRQWTIIAAWASVIAAAAGVIAAITGVVTVLQ